MTDNNNSNYLDRLNPQQRAAVEYCDGPQLVIAGAGSGKTRVLTYKIVHLLHLGYQPWRIMALTFTNKAAREMRSRIEDLVGKDTSDRLWMGTFHSIFSRLLRRHADRIGFRSDFTIYDTTDSRSLVKLIVKELGLNDDDYKPASLQKYFSNLKNDLITPEIYRRNDEYRKADDKAGRPLTAKIYDTYCERCRVAGAMDFDDLLLYTNILLRDCPDVLEQYQEYFSYVLVDEYQDTNFAQDLIIRQLAQKHRRFTVVGDDAQSIYSFRGANIGNILNMCRQWSDLKEFKLEQNYRSTVNIIEAANSLIDKNVSQIRKHIFTSNKEGKPIAVIRCLTDYEEAYIVASQIMSLKARTGCSYNDIAVLYRTNAQSRVLEEAFIGGGVRDKHASKRRGIPYRIYGGLSFYQRKEIKDALAYFRLTVNPHDDEALRRVINTPKRGIGDTTMAKVQHCAVMAGVSLWEVLNDQERYSLIVNKGTATKLHSFAAMIGEFAQKDSEGTAADDLAQQILSRTGILALVLDSKTPEAISTRENLEELMNAIKSFVADAVESGDNNTKLTHFLAQASLMTDQDEEQKNGGDCVTLMTVHAAKGLEFKNVIIVGCEDGLFPSELSRDTLAGIEEERRLLYVAITRAKENCVITWANQRYRNGSSVITRISPFVSDIDPQYLTMQRRRDELDEDEEEEETTFTAFRPTRPILQGSDKRRREVSPLLRRMPTPTPTPAKNVNSAFRKHAIDELQAGMTISHPRFGMGTITNVVHDRNGDHRIIVKFDRHGERALLIAFATFQIVKK